jgi:DNA-binding IclR family transcriptional regulator
VGTVFHRTHLPLRKWFAAISLILDATDQITVRQLARQLGINKNTALRLNKQIAVAMLEPSQRDLLLEIADISETQGEIA